MLDFYACHRKHFHGIGFVMIMLFAHYPFYAAVDYEHRASPARCHLAVNCSAVNRNSALCGLTDCILLSMDSPDAVLRYRTVIMNHLPHQVSCLVTMRKPGRTSDVPCHKNLVVAGDDAARTASVTRCPFRYSSCDFHEIFVPSRSDIWFFNVFRRIFNRIFQLFHSLKNKVSDENESKNPCDYMNFLDFSRHEFADCVRDNAPNDSLRN